jgi:hypothetical protein
MPGNVTVRSLICEGGLGYCCVWFFFQHYRNTELIADRLGVTSRAVRLAKAKVDSGDAICERRGNCMHARITLEGNPRQRPLQLPSTAKRDESADS